MQKQFAAVIATFLLVGLFSAAHATPGVDIDVAVHTHGVTQNVGATALSTAHSGDYNAIANGSAVNALSSVTLEMPTTFNDSVDVSVMSHGNVLQNVGATAKSWSGDADTTASALNAVSSVTGMMGNGSDSIEASVSQTSTVTQNVRADAQVLSNNSGLDAATANATAANGLSIIDVSQVGYNDSVGSMVTTGQVMQNVSSYANTQSLATATAGAVNGVSSINLN